MGPSKTHRDGPHDYDDTSNARLRLARDALQPFQVSHDEMEFLTDAISLDAVSPHDLGWLLSESLVAGADSWNALIDCARSIRHRRGVDPRSLEGSDVLESVWYMHGYPLPLACQGPWEDTDRLIALAREQQSRCSSAQPPSSISSTPHRRGRDHAPLQADNISRGRRLDAVSHFWAADPAEEAPAPHEVASVGALMYREPLAVRSSQASQQQQPAANVDVSGKYLEAGPKPESKEDPPLSSTLDEQPVRPGSVFSPYFSSSPSPKKKSPSKRPPRGTLSCIPFPRLDAPSFGLIQEVFAHEPFWLLVAVTFLIRTKGTAALPVFYAIKALFPTPDAVADPANAEEITGMIRHLGLAGNRLGLLQKYATIFLENPPQAGKVYRVRNYDQAETTALREEAMPSLLEEGTGNEDQDSGVDTDHHETWHGTETTQDATATGNINNTSTGAWEIGHMTQGKYTIDSWRIFCRDELLGRASDWNGAGQSPEFQPEWMRVRPDDKELRAYLRWMWMREGWEWDPKTGERQVLRDELARAVNEGRVEYDEQGGLRIMDGGRRAGEMS